MHHRKCLSDHPTELRTLLPPPILEKNMIILKTKRKTRKVWYLGGGMMYSGPLRTSGSFSRFYTKDLTFWYTFLREKKLVKLNYMNGFSISPSELYFWQCGEGFEITFRP